VAQAVKHLPSKCEALSSNPFATRKKKRHIQTNIPDDYYTKLVLPIYYLARYQRLSYFEIGSCYNAQAGLKLLYSAILPPQPPEW
jgi:hypothetical protein